MLLLSSAGYCISSPLLVCFTFIARQQGDFGSTGQKLTETLARKRRKRRACLDAPCPVVGLPVLWGRTEGFTFVNTASTLGVSELCVG